MPLNIKNIDLKCEARAHTHTHTHKHTHTHTHFISKEKEIKPKIIETNAAKNNMGCRVLVER
jgi:hypothetical protein